MVLTFILSVKYEKVSKGKAWQKLPSHIEKA